MSIYANSVMVTLSNSNTFITLQTYDRKHGSSQRFYISKEALERQLNENTTGSIIENDLLNYCTVSTDGTNIRLLLVWLHGSYNDDVYGYQQTIFLPIEKVKRAISGERIKHLSHCSGSNGKACIYFTQTANSVIASADKLKRHAICRFFRDNFNYGRTEKLVVQEDKWVNGFYFFSTVSRYEGGIVLHKTEVKGRDGKPHPKVFFGLHT